MDKYKNMTCLIADDFSTARRIIKNALQELGFSCLEAENGEQALEIIEQTTINLLIADVHMPDKSGMELLEDIRADDILKDIPVILTMIEPLDKIITEGEELGIPTERETGITPRAKILKIAKQDILKTSRLIHTWLHDR